jgi:hypothetical protein
MAKTEIDDPMCACETCRKQFKDYNLRFRKNYTPTQKINYNDFLNIKNATDKSTKRINNILSNIKKMKKGSTKKYQIRGYYEYKQISKELNILNIRHKLEISDTLFTNKLTELELYINSNYPRQQYQNYINEKVNCMYINVWT